MLKHWMVLILFAVCYTMPVLAQDKASDLKRLFILMDVNNTIDKTVDMMLPEFKKYGEELLEGEDAQVVDQKGKSVSKGDEDSDLDSESESEDDADEETKAKRKAEWDASDKGKLTVRRGVLLRYARDVAVSRVSLWCDVASRMLISFQPASEGAYCD